MGGFLDKPKTTLHVVDGKAQDLTYAVVSMQGWRCEMEDAYSACADLSYVGLKNWSFFAVFDGHAGCEVSKYCAQKLLYSIIDTKEFQSGDYVNGMRSGFLNLDEDMRKLPFDAEKCGGTTALCAFISPTHVYIANCGDSRAVLCRQGVPVIATQDHKPVLPMEKERIHNAGGTVMIKRVNGTLAVSRALGDYDFKNVEGKGQCEQLVSPEPEIYSETRQETDEFLVLACDGIWDVMSNEDVCSFIHSRLKLTDHPIYLAQSLVNTCLHKGSRDNMSVIVIVFPGAPKATEEASEAEKRLEKEMEKIIREEIQSSQTTNFNELLVALRDRNIEGLPPGGGIHSKYDLIKQIYNEYFPEQDCESTSH